MFKNERKNSAQIANTVIGEGIVIESALFKGTGTVRVDGVYSGEMQIDGSVIIGENGVIRGNIKSGNVFIAGSVEGNIVCDNEIHFAQTAVVDGNLSSQSVVIDEGATFNGSCSMMKRVSGNDQQKDTFKVDKMKQEPQKPDAQPQLKELKELKGLKDIKDLAQ